MAKRVQSATTRRSNGGVTTRHRVIIEHDNAPAFDEQQSTLDSVMKKANPPHRFPHVGGTQPSGGS